jgi:hypothetical protein
MHNLHHVPHREKLAGMACQLAVAVAVNGSPTYSSSRRQRGSVHSFHKPWRVNSSNTLPSPASKHTWPQSAHIQYNNSSSALQSITWGQISGPPPLHIALTADILSAHHQRCGDYLQDVVYKVGMAIADSLPYKHSSSTLLPTLMGVFVTREHVRHNKSGITHRGKTRISH